MATHSSVLAWRIPGTEEPSWDADYGVAQLKRPHEVYKVGAHRDAEELSQVLKCN